ncbi:MAG: hypothetical protein RLZZ58_281, partial [Pseudomonadota bacterium]
GDLAAAGVAMAEMPGLAGRGARHHIAVGDGHATLIDESYNANPASMMVTIEQLGREQLCRESAGRRIAVLGAMKELGPESDDFHAGLAAPILAAGIDHVFLVGAEMSPLAKALEGRANFAHGQDADAALAHVQATLADGDVILVKGSNSVGLSRLVAALTRGS